MMLVDRYDDRAHFIFELLQNAEDALNRRGVEWKGLREVTFDLTLTSLKLSHFGQPFNEVDVRGVCGIAESTKDKFSIGRFGIGFKSVYMFTDRPQIHSGEENFAIENYVQPKFEVGRERKFEETQIILPFKSLDETALQEITEGLQRLGPSSLLFLRHINEINWSVEGGASGAYIRSAPEILGDNVQRITVIGQESGNQEVDENWLVFQRDVFSVEKEKVGCVEIAFSLSASQDVPERWLVKPVATSPLVVFFPTVVSTNLGFLVQGPYRTTPSRDNIPRGDPWNQHLVEETGVLVLEAMRWLRDYSMLDISALRCFPLEREKFPKDSVFAPIFELVRQTLLQEPLLPSFYGGYVPASKAKLGRTQDLRELLSSEQLAVLFGGKVDAWLSSDISHDRAAVIRQYVIRELDVSEVTPVNLMTLLKQNFLEIQSDDWVMRFYEFLNSNLKTLSRYFDAIPLVRLTDGSHVVARENGKPRAFLPGSNETGFPTVRSEVCTSSEACKFLISLGITEPDPADDVVRNILPKYQLNSIEVDDKLYSADIQRIIFAFSSDSTSQKNKLREELRQSFFVKVIDTRNGNKSLAKPSDIYIATERLKHLFAGVSNILIVDDTNECLRGEGIRELLESCGALRYPRPIKTPNMFTSDELKELRRKAGHEAKSGSKDEIEDFLLEGFDDLLKSLPALSFEERAKRAILIWESLGDLGERGGRGFFEGSYSWKHNYGNYKNTFPAAFLRRLNTSSWVPDSIGDLHPPNLVVFDSLNWKADPFLLSKIIFKPPIIDQLAKAAGIDPAALDLLKKLGITSVKDLTSRLGIIEQMPEAEIKTEAHIVAAQRSSQFGKSKELDNSAITNIPSIKFDNGGTEMFVVGGGKQGNTTTGALTISDTKDSEHSHDGRLSLSGERGGKVSGTQVSRTPGQGGGRPFISYVGMHPDEFESDPDGLDQATRMKIEQLAIEHIVKLEPSLNRTPEGNPGYDLYEYDSNGEIFRWVEVKSMSGEFSERPVGLSRKQMNCAQEKGHAFWLYVVENTFDPEKINVIRIQDPFNLAKTFTFDSGWTNFAIKPSEI